MKSSSTLLDRRLRELHSNRVELVRPVRELAQIFRASLCFRYGEGRFDSPLSAASFANMRETVMRYKPAQTFEDFLKVNRLPVYEEELR